MLLKKSTSIFSLLLVFVSILAFSNTKDEINKDKKIITIDKNTYIFDDGGKDGAVNNNNSTITYKAKNGTLTLFFPEIQIPNGATLSIYRGEIISNESKIASFESITKSGSITDSVLTIEYIATENTQSYSGWVGILNYHSNETAMLMNTKPESDCVGALNVCNNTTINTSANQYANTGAVNDDAGSCYSGTGSGGSVWYSFVPQSNGLLDFSIAPLGSTDYDYVLWDITNGCESKTQLSCNFSGTAGTTGLNSSGSTNSQDASGTVWNKRETVATTNRYAICINYYGGTNGGFNLTFKNEASSVSIFDVTPPTIVNVTADSCPSASSIELFFSEYIDCSTIQGTDFTLAGYTFTVANTNCTGNLPTASGKTTGIKLTVSPALTTGSYTLNATNILDLCGNNMNSNFNITIGSLPNAVVTTASPVCRTTNFVFGIPSGFTYTPANQTITASGGTTYFWPINNSTSASQTFAPTVTTTYTVYVQNGACSVPVSRTINVEPVPTPNLGTDQTICGSQITLTTAAISGATYNFYSNPVSATNNGTLLNTSTTNSFLATGITGTTTFRVVVISANGCEGRDDMTVTLGGSATANAGTAQTICGGGSVTLNGTTSAASYFWTSDASLSCTNCLTPVASPTSTTTYTLNATCPDGTTSISNVTITVQPYGQLNQVTESTCDPSEITFNTLPNVSGATSYTYNWYSANSVIAPCPTSTAGLTLETTETKPVFTNQTLFSENFDALSIGTLPSGNWSESIVTASVNSWSIGNTGVGTPMANNVLEIKNSSTFNAYTTNDDANKIAYIGNINGTNASNIKLQFDWKCVGQRDALVACFIGTTPSQADYGLVCYSTDGNTWTDFSTKYYNQATVTTATISLPTSLNNTNFYIGFRWVNDAVAGCTATNPFMIDNVLITADVSQNYSSSLNPASGISSDKTYIVEVIPNGGACNAVSYIASNCSQVTLSNSNVATNFNYTNTEYCIGTNNPSPNFISGGTAGTFSATPTGLIFINNATGEIDLENSQAGTYQITNTITSTGACSAGSSSNYTITLNNKPIVTIAASDTSICEGETIGISASGSTSYNWNNGLGASESFNISPTATTTYIVVGTNTNGCQNHDTLTIAVNSIDDATFNYGSSSYCLNSSNPTPSITQTGGIFSATNSLPINNSTGEIDLSVAAEGTFSITYITAGSCPDTNSTSIILSNSPSTSFSYATSYCKNESNPIPVLNTSAISGVFSSTNGLVFSDSLTGEINLNTSTSGTYTITNSLAAAGGCAESSDSYTLTINSLPTVSANSQTICLGTSVTLAGNGADSYTWNNGISNGVSFTPTTAGTTDYIVEGTDANGCKNADTVSVTVYQLPNVSANPQTICLVNSVTLTGNGADSYSWNNSVSNGVSFTPTSAGTTDYIVEGTDVNGCKNADTVSVTVYQLPSVSANSQTICLGTSVTLTGNGANSYTWNNGISNGVSFTPTAAGTTDYIVEGTDANGCKNADTVSVTVYQLPSVSANSQTICLGNSVSLTGNGADSYTWNNGISNGVSFNPTTAGTTDYIVEGTDANGCKNADTISVTVYQLPNVSANPQTICLGNSVTLTGNGADSYTWNNGVSNGVSFTPTSAGTTDYIVEGTDANGCKNADTVSVTVYQLPTISANSQTICLGNSVTLTGNGADSYTWNNGISNGVSFNPTTAGTTDYIVEGTDANGCKNADTVSVTVNSLDDASFTYSGTTFCSSGTNPLATSNFTGGIFSANSGLTINTVTGEIILASSNNGTFNVIYTTNGNCPATDSVSITITNALDATFSYATSYCKDVNNPIAVISSGATAGTFSSANGLVFINSNNGEIDLLNSTSGTYTVKNQIDATGGCAATSYETSITIKDLPIIDAGSNQNLCNSNFRLSANELANATYNWFPANQITASNNGYNPDVILTNGSNNLKVEVTVDGCSAKDSVVLNYFPVLADFTSSTTDGEVALSVNFTNQSENATTYNWQLGNNSTSTEVNPLFTFETEGVYEVILTASNEFCMDTASTKITIRKTEELFIPNVFTPNGDGVHDEFKISGSGFTDYSAKIYNRWGQFITELKSTKETWKGELINGNDVSSGVYYIYINAKLNGSDFKYNGTVTILD
jgi:gliding motility-associated-like protein